eukprot:gene4146-5231_t
MPHGFETQGDSSDDFYIGLADAKEDIKRRVALVEDVLAKAISIRAYTLAESTNQEVVNSLIDLVTDEKWADWLFVFGTAVAFKEPNLDNKPHDQGGHEVYNTALVLKGGLKTREATIASRKLVIKETISDIDYLNNTVNPNTNAVDTSALLWKETKKPTIIDPTSGIFTFNDVVFGLEVCLDHASQRLVKLGESYPELVNSVQVQLIPSCGMTVQDPSVVVRPNKSTVVFGVDGLQYFNGNKFISKGANSEVFIYTDT